MSDLVGISSITCNHKEILFLALIFIYLSQPGLFCVVILIIDALLLIW